MIQLRCACGRLHRLPESVNSPPDCPCGHLRVTRVTAPAPRFRGSATGPSATWTPVSAFAEPLAAVVPLKLKAPKEG